MLLTKEADRTFSHSSLRMHLTQRLSSKWIKRTVSILFHIARLEILRVVLKQLANTFMFTSYYCDLLFSMATYDLKNWEQFVPFFLTSDITGESQTVHSKLLALTIPLRSPLNNAILMFPLSTNNRLNQCSFFLLIKSCIKKKKRKKKNPSAID